MKDCNINTQRIKSKRDEANDAGSYGHKKLWYAALIDPST